MNGAAWSGDPLKILLGLGVDERLALDVFDGRPVALLDMFEVLRMGGVTLDDLDGVSLSLTLDIDTERLGSVMNIDGLVSDILFELVRDSVDGLRTGIRVLVLDGLIVYVAERLRGDVTEGIVEELIDLLSDALGVPVPDSVVLDEGEAEKLCFPSTRTTATAFHGTSQRLDPSNTPSKNETLPRADVATAGHEV